MLDAIHRTAEELAELSVKTHELRNNIEMLHCHLQLERAVFGDTHCITLATQEKLMKQMQELDSLQAMTSTIKFCLV